jgi:hypothetical protein
MPTDTSGAASISPVDHLRRWEEFGAVWRVVRRDRDSVTISMCRCDGGEEVDRLTSADPELVAWLAGRTRSDEPPTR